MIPLATAVHCMDCNCVSEAHHHTCPVCQSSAIFSIWHWVQPIQSVAVLGHGAEVASIAILERLYKRSV